MKSGTPTYIGYTVDLELFNAYRLTDTLVPTFALQ